MCTLGLEHGCIRHAEFYLLQDPQEYHKPVLQEKIYKCFENPIYLFLEKKLELKQLTMFAAAFLNGENLKNKILELYNFLLLADFHTLFLYWTESSWYEIKDFLEPAKFCHLAVLN